MLFSFALCGGSKIVEPVYSG